MDRNTPSNPSSRASVAAGYNSTRRPSVDATTNQINRRTINFGEGGIRRTPSATQLTSNSPRTSSLRPVSSLSSISSQAKSSPGSAGGSSNRVSVIPNRSLSRSSSFGTLPSNNSKPANVRSRSPDRISLAGRINAPSSQVNNLTNNPNRISFSPSVIASNIASRIMAPTNMESLPPVDPVPVKVALRLLPNDSVSPSPFLIHNNESQQPQKKTTVTFWDTSRAGVADGNGAGGTERNFEFDYVFEESAGQVGVFDGAVEGLVEKVVEGFNACVFAYGQ
ncbi:hypothetical protein HK102_005197, partial [Quaeritorhiza haematococci]